MTEDEMNHREIIIVRRADPGHDDGHHGGVWKIAFADFMTAMMAFFLVMWLINAANEETKKAVASYFTPIKLTDRTSNPKGLKDPKYGKAEESTEEQDDESTFASGGKLNQKVPDPVQVDEQAIFTDPYAILSEIAGGLVSGELDGAEAEEKKNQGAALGISGGEAFHDPFDPSSWNTELGLARRDAMGGSADTSKNGDMAAAPASQRQDARDAASVAETADTKTKSPLASPDRPETADKAGPATQGELRSGVAPDGEKRAGSKEKAEVPAADGQGAAGEASQKGEAAADGLRRALAALTGKEGGGPHIEIKAQGSGVLISVSDEFKFGMFDIGSSVPRKETVLAMAEIGKALSQIEGAVIVAGHTDARKYRSGDYDNWRLSTDRAHIARYMLIRGGLDEGRVERIEGSAASKLKIADDPFAAGNRRIEIFVRLP